MNRRVAAVALVAAFTLVSVTPAKADVAGTLNAWAAELFASPQCQMTPAFYDGTNCYPLAHVFDFTLTSTPTTECKSTSGCLGSDGPDAAPDAGAPDPGPAADPGPGPDAPDSPDGGPGEGGASACKD